MRAWGEGAWTASDLVAAEEHLVTDQYGTIYGRFQDKECALIEREFLGSIGIESWVVPVADLEIEEDPC